MSRRYGTKNRDRQTAVSSKSTARQQVFKYKCRRRPPVDNVRRDARDGAYHCPQCDTPFTRRSNLRRHFQIHMRSPLFKCENCGEEYTTKAELHNHATTCHSMAWNNVNEKTFRSIEEAYGKSTTYSSSGTMDVPSSGITNGFVDTRSYATPSTPFPTFESHEPQYNGNHHLMPALSSPGSVTSPLMSSNDGNFTHSSSPPSAFSHRRPSTSSSNSSSSTHSSPYIYPTGHPQHTSYGYYPSTDVRPDNSLWNAVPPSTSTNVEIPVYTRRQVKDMIDVVSECLIESMENVLTRPTSISPGGINMNAADGHLVHSIRDNGFRQTVLSEAMPRAYYRIRSGSGVNPMV